MAWAVRGTQALRDFLMQCFQKDCNLRVSAAKLLRHPWLQKTRPKEAAVRRRCARGLPGRLRRT